MARASRTASSSSTRKIGGPSGKEGPSGFGCGAPVGVARLGLKGNPPERQRDETPEPNCSRRRPASDEPRIRDSTYPETKQTSEHAWVDTRCEGHAHELRQ